MAQLLSFFAWMEQVNAHITRLSGLTADDIDDFDYLPRYNAGRSANATARLALRNAGWRDKA